MNTPKDGNQFEFHFDVVTAIYVKEAAKEKAKAERERAAEFASQALIGGALSHLLALQSIQAENRAQRLEEAAEAMHDKIHPALVADMDRALRAVEQ